MLSSNIDQVMAAQLDGAMEDDQVLQSNNVTPCDKLTKWDKANQSAIFTNTAEINLVNKIKLDILSPKDKLNFIKKTVPHWAMEVIEERIYSGSLDPISIKPNKLKYIEKIYEQICLKIPVSRILGIKYFFNGVFCNKNVLDPRYDSETIIDILNLIAPYYENKKCSIIELGGGSGCLSVTAGQIINHCSLTIVEKSSLAIKTLRRNLRKNKIYCANVYEGSWWEPIKDKEVKFNILIFNPPYLSMEDMMNGDIFNIYDDPIIALYGGLTGIEPYEHVLREVKKYITDYVIMEICSEKIDLLFSLMAQYNYHKFTVFDDLCKRQRMILIDLT